MGTALVYTVLFFDHIWHVKNPCCGRTKFLFVNQLCPSVHNAHLAGA